MLSHFRKLGLVLLLIWFASCSQSPKVSTDEKAISQQNLKLPLTQLDLEFDEHPQKINLSSANGKWLKIKAGEDIPHFSNSSHDDVLVAPKSTKSRKLETVEFKIETHKSGEFCFEYQGSGFNGGSNSFFVSINGSPFKQIGSPVRPNIDLSTIHWSTLFKSTKLNAGINTLTFKAREPGFTLASIRYWRKRECKNRIDLSIELRKNALYRNMPNYLDHKKDDQKISRILKYHMNPMAARILDGSQIERDKAYRNLNHLMSINENTMFAPFLFTELLSALLPKWSSMPDKTKKQLKRTLENWHYPATSGTINMRLMTYASGYLGAEYFDDFQGKLNSTRQNKSCIFNRFFRQIKKSPPLKSYGS